MKILTNQAVTLMELIICLVLMLIMVLGFSQVDTFVRQNVVVSTRRSELQHTVSLTIDHIAKQLNRAVGSIMVGGKTPVSLTAIAGDTALRIYVDAASDRKSPGNGNYDAYDAGPGAGDPGDCWRAYRYIGSGANQHQLWYYNNYVNASSAHEVLATKIAAFTVSITGNYATLNLTACWDPLGAGSIDNPCVVMRSQIQMPSVSTR
jgi:hypothetical protein